MGDSGELCRRPFLAALAALAVGAPLHAATPARVGTASVENGRAVVELTGRKSLVVVSSLDLGAGTHEVRVRDAGPDRPRTALRFDPADRGRPGPTSPLPPVPPEALSLPPAERTFAMLVRDGDPAGASNYAEIRGRLLGVGKRVQVYADASDLAGIDAGLAADLVSAFDGKVFPLAAERFGPAADVDGDGRFTILVSSRLDRVPGGGGKVDGFVRGADLDLSLESPFGNRCDMMYVNASLRPGPHARTVLAHEYTHAVVFSRRALDRRGAGRDEEGWLDEGLAHLVEDLHGFSKSNIDYRVSAFLSRPERYRLVVEDYYSADLFRSHGNRGGTYLFLRWLADRHGDDLVTRLIRTDLRGVANLEAATGRPFADLYSEWAVSLFLSGVEPEDGRGYRSIDPRGTIEDWILAGPRTVRAAAGRIDESWTMTGTSSRYLLIDGPGAVEVDGAPDAKLRVCVAPLPDDLGSIDLGVRAVRGRDGRVEVRATVTERGGSPVRLGAFCWESLVPTTEAEKSRGGLDMLGIARAFDGSALPERGRKTSRPIPIGSAEGRGGPTVFKIVGTDAGGRRVAAWAELSGEEDE